MILKSRIYQREEPSRDARSIFIFCEGAKREKQYFEHFREIDSRINIEVLSQVFINAGFQEIGDYHFTEKKLYAKHFEHPSLENAPRVFISQLLLEEFTK